MAAHDLVSRCPCRHGCPACVGPILDHEYALDTKGLTTSLLQSLLADEGPAHPENSKDCAG